MEFMKQVLPKFDRPQIPGFAFSDIAPPSLWDPKLYLVLIELVDAGVGGVGIFRSLLVFSMAPVDVEPFEVDSDVVVGVVGVEMGISAKGVFARALFVLKVKYVKFAYR